ncbi:MAG: hypothetical protein SGILL_007919, partial [Bacillariaceae sp.]
QIAQAALTCKTDQDCLEKLQRPESFCTEDGYCSNPFVKGCLATLRKNRNDGITENALKGIVPTRICNSDDFRSEEIEHDDENENTVALPTRDFCIPQDFDFDYPEIRIHNGNWESSIFLSWILQIILMEVLQVPATVGLTTNTTAKSSFYAVENTLEYSAEAYPFDALQNGVNCEMKQEPCIQVMPEIWNGQQHEWNRAIQAGFMEPVEGNGAVGKGSIFIPKFAAQKDPTLVSVYGLQGEDNRHKLAETFRKPLTWLEYCRDVSPTKCDDDPVAAFYPSTKEQEQHYHHPQFYPGYFHSPPASNCVENPTNCTGFIVQPPCSWSTNVDAQLYWNEILLTPDGPVQPNGGYEYKSIVEIWRAANATRSPVMMWYWAPDALVEQFRDGDGAFQQLLLPEATETCSRNRVDTEARCSEDIWVRRGNAEGACDQEFHALQKAVSTKFHRQVESEPLVTKSPAYDFIKQLRVTDLELNGMLRDWVNRKVDPYGNDAREAVCSWVVENYEDLLDFLPPGYPKEIDTVNAYDEGYMIGAIVFAVCTCLAVTAVAGACYAYRQQRVFIYAQTHMTGLILAGFFLISIGAILYAVEPTSGICTAQVWFVNLGYAVHLLPLLVKIAAINKIMSSAKQLKRIKIHKGQMLKTLAGLLGLVIVYLIIWSTVDPIEVVAQRTVSDTTSTVVEECITCTSHNNFWYYLALTFQAIMLLMAAVLAFQSRHAPFEFNESRALGTMTYSHLLFVILRGIVLMFRDRGILEPGVSAAVMSYLLSLDTLTAMGIYIVPKLLQARSPKLSDNEGSQRNTLRGVHASETVGEIKRRASQHVVFSEIDERPSISLRQGHILSLKKLEESTEVNSSFSQTANDSSGSSGRKSLSRVSWQGSTLPEIPQETSKELREEWTSVEIEDSEAERCPMPGSYSIPEGKPIAEIEALPRRVSLNDRSRSPLTEKGLLSEQRLGFSEKLKSMAFRDIMDPSEAADRIDSGTDEAKKDTDSIPANTSNKVTDQGAGNRLTNIVSISKSLQNSIENPAVIGARLSQDAEEKRDWPICIFNV